MMNAGSRILKIGIFYDGNYFYHVSNYYCYSHVRRSRLSIPGLHSFIKSMVAEKEGLSERFCQIVDCHYFRGRLPAKEAYARQILLNERIFDDILMREGVVTHYLPTSGGTEKGVDVALALETLELTLLKNYNVVVLIASDGDYVPLIRKLNALGTRVMVLGWVVGKDVLTQNESVLKALNAYVSQNVVIVLISRRHKTYRVAGIFL